MTSDVSTATRTDMKNTFWAVFSEEHTFHFLQDMNGFA